MSGEGTGARRDLLRHAENGLAWPSVTVYPDPGRPADASRRAVGQFCLARAPTARDLNQGHPQMRAA